MKNPIVLLCFMFLLLSSCSIADYETDLQKPIDEVELQFSGDENFVPFKGSLNVEIDLASVVILPPKYQELLGQGNLTHLGKTDLLIEQYWWPVPNSVPRTGNGRGHITFTAANGDLLFANYNNAVAVHESETYVWVTFTAYFDGGTGRFENAEGHFDWHATFNPALNKGTTKLKGKIHYSR